MELKLYELDNSYLNYLFSIDDRVMFWDSDNYKNERKYVGVVLTINNFEYFAPLSSPKETDYFYKDNEKKIRKSTIPLVRLVTDDGELLAKVKLCSMIPVKNEYITLYDISTEPDQKYQSLVTKEMVCIRKQNNITVGVSPSEVRTLYSELLLAQCKKFQSECFAALNANLTEYYFEAITVKVMAFYVEEVSAFVR